MHKKEANNIFIAGNGPSLKEVDFTYLKGKEWVGMNSAYRYWGKINIFPTVYCCLDKVVIQNHAFKIAELLNRAEIRKAFLVKEILNIVPEIEDNPKVDFLEDLVAYSSKKTAIFRTYFSQKKTTGSWAIRYAIYLGFKTIYLSGIDCNYVEIVDGANRTGDGLELEIESDSKANPNYFFSDYQQKGDKYQVPNPESHFGNMHLQSLEAVEIDIERLKLDVDVYNTAKNSQLYRFGIFPYINLDSALGKASLSAVVIPLIKEEIEVFIENLEVWDLHAFHPLKLNSVVNGKIVLHLFIDSYEDKKLVEKIQYAYNRTKYICYQFKEIRITFLDIPKSINRYQRNKEILNESRKIGPNVMFFSIMRESERYQYIFLMESDCTPGKSNWLGNLDDFCKGNDPFWVGGSLSGLPTSIGLDPGLALHFNGNAIYATGDKQFQKFLANVWKEAIEYIGFVLLDPHIAYDIVLSKVLTYGTSVRLQKDLGGIEDKRMMFLFEKLTENLGKFIQCKEIQNTQVNKNSNILSFIDDPVGPSVIHSKKINDLCRKIAKQRFELIKNDSIDENIKKYFLHTHLKTPPYSKFDAFHYFNNREGLLISYLDLSNRYVKLQGKNIKKTTNIDKNNSFTILFGLENIKIGDNLILLGEMYSDTDISLELRFARHGNGPFIHKDDKVTLKQKVKKVFQLELSIKERYEALRLNILPLSSFGFIDFKWKIIKNHSGENKNHSVIVIRPEKSNNIKDRFLYLHRKYWKKENELLSLKNKNLENKLFNKYPRVLIIDQTIINGQSATGQLKGMLFEKWPNDSIMQLYQHGSELRIKKSEVKQTIIDFNQFLNKCIDFNPEVIYLRPTDSIMILEYALRIYKKMEKPLVLHMMDDWPERLRHADKENFIYIDRLLRDLLSRTNLSLSISEKMSNTYAKRYGVNFHPVHNGVEVESIPVKDWSNRAPFDFESPFVVRYMGGLADDMNFDAIKMVANVIERVSKRFPIVMDLFTMPWYMEKAQNAFGHFKKISVKGLVPIEEYYQKLSEADALLLAYNFDESTRRYVGLSFANKVPEVLAVSVPVIAFGPDTIPTIKYLNESACAHVITEQSEDELEKTFIHLMESQIRCSELGHLARRNAEKFFKKDKIQNDFYNMLNNISKCSGNKEKMLNGKRNNDNNFSKANKLYREGSFEEALKIYNNLFKQTGLNIYHLNMTMTLRKIRLSKKDSVNYYKNN